MAKFSMVAVLAAAAAVAACSGSPAPSGDSESRTGSESTPTSAVPSVGHGSLAYCLSEHGVATGPGPAPGPPPGVDAETWERAMAECSSLAPGPAG